MKNQPELSQKMRYILACVVIGGILEFILGFVILGIDQIGALIVSASLGILITALLAYRLPRNKKKVTRSSAIGMGLFMGFLSHLFVMTIFFLLLALGSKNSDLEGNLIAYLIYLFYALYISVFTSWVFIPIYYLIGRFTLKRGVGFYTGELDENLQDEPQMNKRADLSS
jgi:cytochrome c biogenesis protein CcdA